MYNLTIKWTTLLNLTIKFSAKHTFLNVLVVAEVQMHHAAQLLEGAVAEHRHTEGPGAQLAEQPLRHKGGEGAGDGVGVGGTGVGQPRG